MRGAVGFLNNAPRRALARCISARRATRRPHQPQQHPATAKKPGRNRACRRPAGQCTSRVVRRRLNLVLMTSSRRSFRLGGMQGNADCEKQRPSLSRLEKKMASLESAIQAQASSEGHAELRKRMTQDMVERLESGLNGWKQ